MQEGHKEQGKISNPFSLNWLWLWLLASVIFFVWTHLTFCLQPPTGNIWAEHVLEPYAALVPLKWKDALIVILVSIILDSE
jgi:hypothetical protein